MIKSEFIKEFGEQLQLNVKTWDIPKFGISGWSILKPEDAYVQVSLRDEIENDSLYYTLNGAVYELDVAFLKPDLLDYDNHVHLGLELIQKGKLKAIKVPLKYLIKHDINIYKKAEEKIMVDVMTDLQMDNLVNDWSKESLLKKESEISKDNILKSLEAEFVLKDWSKNWVSKQSSVFDTKKTINRLLSNEDFETLVKSNCDNTKESLLKKRNKYSKNGNWDDFFRKAAMRKQKSVLSVCDGFLDKDLERYYELLSLLSINDNVSKDIIENTELQDEVEDVFNSISNWFILQKFQMLKQIRNKI